jgi:sulfur carrier protein
VHVNGEALDVDDSLALGALVDEAAGTRRGIAVARNGDVVPRSRWDETTVTADDRIEILGAAQGG